MSARIEITLPAGTPRCIVKTETTEGSAVPGVPFRFISGDESEPFDLEPGQRLVVELYPEKDPT